MKGLIEFVYIALLVVMAAATIIETKSGSEAARTAVYGSWWFCLLWGVLAVAGVIYILRRHVRHVGTLMLHLSFVIILLGALITHLTARQGMMHLRVGMAVDSYLFADGHGGMRTVRLPFALCLQEFKATYHQGTRAVADYTSRFVVIDGAMREAATVSMNKIYTHRSVRFYQASYDEDGRGSVLSVNSDPLGIPVTYTGYVLLFFSLIWMLIDPKGPYRRLLRSLRKMSGAAVPTVLVVVALLWLNAPVQAQTTLPRESADRFGRVCMLYNDRICPVETYALDFCKKVYGARTYKGLTAEQVLAGWIFFGDEWAEAPFIKVKGSPLRRQTGLGDYATLNSFFGGDGYVLGPLVEEYYQGSHDKLHKQAAGVDDKVMLIMQLRQGIALKVLPYTTEHGVTTWFSPVDSLPAYVEAEHASYIKNVFPLIYEDVRARRWERVNEFFDLMLRYQQTSAGSSMPTPTQYRAERLNNVLPLTTVLFMLNLALGLVALLYFIYRMTHRRTFRAADFAFPILLGLSWLALTFTLALRWIISGNVPMSNGYETMLVVAWFVQLISLLVVRRFPIVLVFGFLLSGFFLLVSHLGQMDPAIGQMMPVLNSPLLSIHVGIIMMSYALLSLTFICAIMGLLVPSHGGELQLLSQVLLYPAITTLGIGIFIGAIWANVSWGTYWSWDPKETWALITFMIYAIGVHPSLLPGLQKPRSFHVFMLLAFLSIIVTYFGVNYFMTGMHSYA